MSTETVPKGYKRTEVGVIPEEWDVKQIGELCETSSGTTPSRVQHERYYSNGTINWIKTLDLNNGIITKTEERVTELALAETSLQVYPEGTVVVAMYGGYNQIGRTGLTTFPASVNQALTAIRPKPTSLHPQYLLKTLNHRIEYWKLVASSSRKDPNITSKDVRDFTFACPALAEQQAIAAALSDADALIEALESLLAKKRQIKQGAMQELLTGKRRLPGFTGKWCEAILNDFLLSAPDYGINAPGVPDTGDYPRYLRITDITDDGRFAPPVQAAVNHPESSRYILSNYEIVFARTGASVGKSYLYKEADGELVFAGFLIRAKIDPSKLSPEYLAAYTHTAGYWNWVRLMSMRSGQPGINGQEYASMSFRIPPSLPEQTAIAAVLSDMDSELEALEAKLDKARQIKQGMMQQLLTGKVRLV